MGNQVPIGEQWEQRLGSKAPIHREPSAEKGAAAVFCIGIQGRPVLHVEGKSRSRQRGDGWWGHHSGYTVPRSPTVTGSCFTQVAFLACRISHTPSHAHPDLCWALQVTQQVHLKQHTGGLWLPKGASPLRDLCAAGVKCRRPGHARA